MPYRWQSASSRRNVAASGRTEAALVSSRLLVPAKRLSSTHTHTTGREYRDAEVANAMTLEWSDFEN